MPDVHQADLEDRDVADRDPEAIKQEIDRARDQLAATVDLLAERADPRRLADDIKARVIEFVSQPVVIVTLAGISSVVMVVVIRRIRDR